MQVEILGASLVWTALGRTSGMCRHKKAFGPRRDSFAAYLQQQKKPVPSSVALLSLDDAAGDESPVKAPPASNSNQVFDLLTGEFLAPAPSSPSVSSNAPTPNNNNNRSSNGRNFNKSSSQNLSASDTSNWNNPFLNERNPSSGNSSAKHIKPPSASPETRKSVSQEHPGVEVYLGLLKTLYGTTPVSDFNPTNSPSARFNFVVR